MIRREEARMLEMLTIVVHPFEAEAHQKSGLWYLLEAEWFREWSAFLQNGGERPGSIENGQS